MWKKISAIAAGVAASSMTASAGGPSGFFAPPSGANPFAAPIYAAPIHPGPGTVPLPTNAGPMVAPVLLPVGSPTAAPVNVYHNSVPTLIPTTVPPTSTETAIPTTIPADCEKPACSTGKIWVSADFFYGATQGTYLPPLVTLAPPGSPPLSGGLGTPTTILQFGGRREGNSTRPGAQFRVGYWFDDAQTRGFDAGFSFLGDLSESFSGSTAPGGIVLAQPVVNGLTGANFGATVGSLVPGGISASFSTETIGANSNYRRALVRTDCQRLDLLVGFRYVYLGDEVTVATASSVAAAGAGAGALPLPASVLTVDSFRTRNNFYGPQLGLASSRKLGGGFTFDLLAKVAFGVTVTDADVSGSTSTFLGGVQTTSLPVGVLAGPTNAGSYSSTDFAVVPEAGMKIGYDVTDHFRVSFGYSLVYWSRVRRAPEQIDLTVLAPGRPSYRDQATDVWIQGVTTGFEWRY